MLEIQELHQFFLGWLLESNLPDHDKLAIMFPKDNVLGQLDFLYRETFEWMRRHAGGKVFCFGLGKEMRCIGKETETLAAEARTVFMFDCKVGQVQSRTENELEIGMNPVEIGRSMHGRWRTGELESRVPSRTGRAMI